MTTLHSRSIAEHLSTLASLLEAEAMRANTLGLKGNQDIARQAKEVRRMADQLWDANVTVALEHASRNVGHETKPNITSVH